MPTFQILESRVRFTLWNYPYQTQQSVHNLRQKFGIQGESPSRILVIKQIGKFRNTHLMHWSTTEFFCMICEVHKKKVGSVSSLKPSSPFHHKLFDISIHSSPLPSPNQHVSKVTN